MEVRQKGDDIRISPQAVNGAMDVPYVSIKPAQCWSATWASWGRKSDAAVVSLDGKMFRVILEPLAS